MNDAQRAAIQRHLKLLADDIMLTEELLGIMYQRRLFEKHMIETIKAEKTNTDKLYVMLHMLPKRGPDAFDNFIEILKPNYPWLASTLETTYRDEMTLVRQNSIISMCTACGGNGGLTARSDTQVDGGRQQPEIQVDADVKKKVECFIHKTFGHRKTIAHQDKRCMERWLSEQIQTERKQRRMPRATHRKGSTADLSNPVTSRKVPPKTVNATRKRTYLPISRFP
ncbi:uncharacterized protein LOC127871983 isoform X2 [Dreissena polymorpha]|uniref:uncharacterized protein LOC127871983 isoform X2 n=1 Tax=Dreissena polymorpha TaxID=45954 RepID=UPI002263C892|nr:uncharacterized protein LOC127871983 isoform X2 [Dreissena polymorpha]